MSPQAMGVHAGMCTNVDHMNPPTSKHVEKATRAEEFEREKRNEHGETGELQQRQPLPPPPTPRLELTPAMDLGAEQEANKRNASLVAALVWSKLRRWLWSGSRRRGMRRRTRSSSSSSSGPSRHGRTDKRTIDSKVVFGSAWVLDHDGAWEVFFYSFACCLVDMLADGSIKAFLVFSKTMTVTGVTVDLTCELSMAAC